MRKQEPSSLTSYLVAAGVSVVALLLTMVIPFLRQDATYVLFLGAVSFSSWYGGRGPGIFACLFAALLENYFISEPIYQISLTIEALVPLCMFLLVSLMICYLRGELAKSEATAQEHRRLLEIILSSIGDAVIATDVNQRITFMNSTAESLTGYTAYFSEGMALEAIFRVVEFGDPDQQYGAVSRLFAEDKLVRFPPNLTLFAKENKTMPIEGNAAPIKDKQGHTVGTVLVFRDVTERVTSRDKIVEYQERLRSLALEVSLAGERERRAIATGLHDRVGQVLGLTRIKLGDLRSELSEPQLVTKVDYIRNLMKTIIGEIRSLTFELSPPILYEFGLEAALEWLANTMHKQHNLQCEFKSDGTRLPLKQEYSVILFQTVRELLANVAKHASAKHVTVEITRTTGQVSVRVVDDGAGFDTSQLTPGTVKSGFGLFSIRERLRHLGGTFSIESKPGRGTSAVLALPV